MRTVVIMARHPVVNDGANTARHSESPWRPAAENGRKRPWHPGTAPGATAGSAQQCGCRPLPCGSVGEWRGPWWFHVQGEGSGDTANQLRVSGNSGWHCHCRERAPSRSAAGEQSPGTPRRTFSKGRNATEGVPYRAEFPDDLNQLAVAPTRCGRNDGRRRRSTTKVHPGCAAGAATLGFVVAPPRGGSRRVGTARLLLWPVSVRLASTLSARTEGSSIRLSSPKSRPKPDRATGATAGLPFRHVRASAVSSAERRPSHNISHVRRRETRAQHILEDSRGQESSSTAVSVSGRLCVPIGVLAH